MCFSNMTHLLVYSVFNTPLYAALSHLYPFGLLINQWPTFPNILLPPPPAPLSDPSNSMKFAIYISAMYTSGVGLVPADGS